MGSARPALVLALAGIAVTAHAQSDQGDASAGGRRGTYGGVVPGSGRNPPKLAAARRASVRVLTWPGLQMRPNGASRFFVQTSKPVEPTTRKRDGRYEVILEDTRVMLRNNRRPLETRYFNTPVVRARIEQRGRDVALVLELRVDVPPATDSKKLGDGLHYVFVEFPPGAYLERDQSREAGQETGMRTK